MMDCPNCHKDMMLEEYATYFSNNDQDVTLREEYWCSECNTRAFKCSYYHLRYEEVETK